MAKELTELGLKRKLKALGKLTDQQRNDVVCSLIGHSRIISTCFGYIYCGRCEAQIGDQLGSVYDATENVIIGHKCEKCKENAEKMTWQDRLFVADPFADAAQLEAQPSA